MRQKHGNTKQSDHFDRTASYRHVLFGSSSICELLTVSQNIPNFSLRQSDPKQGEDLHFGEQSGAGPLWDSEESGAGPLWDSERMCE